MGGVDWRMATMGAIKAMICGERPAAMPVMRARAVAVKRADAARMIVMAQVFKKPGPVIRWPKAAKVVAGVGTRACPM